MTKYVNEQHKIVLSEFFQEKAFGNRDGIAGKRSVAKQFHGDSTAYLLNVSV
jgi:hypothetical protein